MTGRSGRPACRRLFCDADSRLYAYSTDYPHIEGGQDPVRALTPRLPVVQRHSTWGPMPEISRRIFGE